jgi:hypothetical protein
MVYGPVKGGETTGGGDDETEGGAEGATASDVGVTGVSLHAASNPPEASNTATWTARMISPLVNRTARFYYSHFSEPLLPSLLNPPCRLPAVSGPSINR